MKPIYFLPIYFLLGTMHLNAQQNNINTNNVEIELLNCNTAKSDFGPAIIDSNLVFSSIDENEKKKKEQFYQLYSLSIDSMGILLDDQKSNYLNLNFHQGPIAYCSASEELFVTQSNWENAELKEGMVKRKNVKLGILIYQEYEDQWKLKDKFPYNSGEYGVAHPAINKTGDTLIFASNMNGGFGQTDLYMSIKVNDIWSKPVNLGEKVNSAENEMMPFLNSDGKLFFASNGFGGEGNLDIFYIDFPITNQNERINLGQPINSSADDFGLILHPNQSIGYFTSNRSGGIGDDDIYSANFAKTELIITPISALSNTLISDIQLTIIEPDGKTVPYNTNEQGQQIISVDRNKNYFIELRKEGFETKTINYTPRNQLFESEKININLEPSIEKITEADIKKVEKVEENIKEELVNYVLKMQDQKFISDNVICEVDVEIIEHTPPDLKVTFSYELINDTLKFQYDDFAKGHYRVEESNAVQVTLSVMKASIEGELKNYISKGKNISINIIGSADGIPIKNTIPYKGEYGKQITEQCNVDNTYRTIEISENKGIRNNTELAFLRSYGVRNYIENEIIPLKETYKKYSHNASVSKQKGGKFRRVSIELIIHNAFTNNN